MLSLGIIILAGLALIIGILKVLVGWYGTLGIAIFFIVLLIAGESK